MFPSKSAMMAGFGIYVHVPFCSKRCDYCAFATWDNKNELIDSYVAACVKDAHRQHWPKATTVFFGGGTPSLLEPDDLKAILDSLGFQDDAEITVECNPETVSANKLAGYYEAGVNRLSFGVQSFVPHVLKSLGRQHDAEHVVSAIEWARQVGFTSINADIIYGAFGESVADWEVTLNRVIELDVEHVSAYALTVESGTPLALDKPRHPDDDDQALKYEVATKLLGDAGYVNYEISNWAKPGHACRHNLLYWAQGNYGAIGCAAHGHKSGTRFWNVPTPELYIEAVRNGDSVVAGEEVLSDETRQFESDELSLRTRWGSNATSFSLDSQQLLDGLLILNNGKARLSERGRMMANEVAMHLQTSPSRA